MKRHNAGPCSLAYDCAGPEDGIPLVFLHGATVDHLSMQNTFEQYFTGLSREYRRVYLDLPGHGESGSSFFRANVADMLADLGAFLRGNFKRPPCLVGYSMGGFLALKLAETTPFPTLFLVAPPVYTDKAKIDRPRAMEPAADELSEEERRGAEPRYLRLAAKKNTRTLESYRANLAPGFYPLRWFYQNRFFRKAIQEDLTIEPERIRSGTVFLAGRQDLLVGYRDQFALSSRLRFSDYHSFSDCGHFLPVECAQFGALFRHWLDDAAVKYGGERGGFVL